MDLQRRLIFQLKAHGICEKAQTEVFEIAIYVNGAEICGKHKASQTCVCMKPINLAAIDHKSKDLFVFLSK